MRVCEHRAELARGAHRREPQPPPRPQVVGFLNDAMVAAGLVKWSGVPILQAAHQGAGFAFLELRDLDEASALLLYDGVLFRNRQRAPAWRERAARHTSRAPARQPCAPGVAARSARRGAARGVCSGRVGGEGGGALRRVRALLARLSAHPRHPRTVPTGSFAGSWLARSLRCGIYARLQPAETRLLDQDHAHRVHSG